MLPVASAASFDLDELWQLCAHEPEERGALLAAVQDTLAQAAALLAAAAAAAQSGQMEQAARELHALRGSVGQLGAQAFADQLLQIELELKRGVAPAPTAFATAQILLESTLSAGRDWLDSIGALGPARMRRDIRHWPLAIKLLEVDAKP